MNWQDEQKKVATGVTGYVAQMQEGKDFTITTPQPIEAMKQALENELSASDFIDKAPKSWDKTERTEWARLQAMLHNIRVFKKAMRQAIANYTDLDAICQDLQEMTYTQAMRIAELEAAVAEQHEKQDKFCDNNCVWTDHHKDCVRAEKQSECTRSHPHENMDQMCELRTEIARLTNELVRVKQSDSVTSVSEVEPVAWIEHEWSGSGLRHLHFERREQSLRDEVVNPIWTPLYINPQPKREPLTDEHIWQLVNDYTIGGDLHADKFARAIEAAHGIKENKCQ